MSFEAALIAAFAPFIMKSCIIKESSFNIKTMPVREYQRILCEVSRLSETDRARLIKELALRARKARKKPDLSKTNETGAYVEGIRMAESRHPSGVLKTPKDFLAELESWEG